MTFDLRIDSEADEGLALLLGISASDVSPTAWENEERTCDLEARPSKVQARQSKPRSTTLAPLPYADIPDTDSVFRFAYKCSGYCTPGGRVEAPAAKVVDLSSCGRGNGLVATEKITRGDVLFTERAAMASQVPHSTGGEEWSFSVRACQNCFRSLEPVKSCQGSTENGANLPHPELWPVPDFHFDEKRTCDQNIRTDVHGRIQCRDCCAWFCSENCRMLQKSELGSCCEVNSSVESLSLLLANEDGAENRPAVVLAVRLFRFCLERHRTTGHIQSTFVEGLCGDEADVVPLELGQLERVHQGLVSIFKITDDEQAVFSLSFFQRLAAISARNGVGLMTQSPFTTYYSSLVRITGGRGSMKHGEMKARVAAALGSESGQLERGMDRLVEALVAAEIVAIFPLTARINHSCSPNAAVRAQEFVDCHMDLIALRDIEKGEEITISYIAVGRGHGRKSRTRRRRELQAKYLFLCECPLCVNDGE